MNNGTYTTRQDAQTAVANCGIADWDWGTADGEAIMDTYADILWDEQREPNDTDLAVALLAHGENVADYSLSVAITSELRDRSDDVRQYI